MAKIKPTKIRHAKKQEVKKEAVKAEAVKKEAVKKAEVKKEEVKKAEVKKEEVKKEEVKKAEVKKAEVKKAEVKKQEVKKDEVKKGEVKKAEVKKQEVKKTEVKKQEVKKQEVKKTEVKKQEVKKTEVKKPEVKKTEVQKEESEEESDEEEEEESEEGVQGVKMSLFSDEEEEDEEEDSDDLEAAEKAEEERKKEEQLADEAEYAEMLQRVEEDGSDFEGDREEDDIVDENGVKLRKPVSLPELKLKMEKNIQVLKDWKNAGETRSREEVLKELKQGLATYYSYGEELVEYFLNLFSPEEAIAFFEANEVKRPVTIRVNTLKTRRQDLANRLSERGINVDKIGDWTKEGLKVFDSQVPLGATIEYLNGGYIIQSASSFIPVMALQPLPNETILDMAAAPGGKTTHIAQRMQQQGTLFANDLKRERCKSLMANIHRLGVQNTVVTNYDALHLKKMLPRLDRVLLDAPCTGSGVISRDPSIKMKRSVKDFLELAELQKKLLLTAIDMVDANSKTGAVIVYSTCSVSVEENENVVNYALAARKNVKLVSFQEQVPFGTPGFKKFRGQTFHASLQHTRRYYPHVHNMDGFFVAKFVKFSNKIPERVKKDNRRTNTPVVKTETPKEWETTLVEYQQEAKAPKKLTKKEKKAVNKLKREEKKKVKKDWKKKKTAKGKKGHANQTNTESKSTTVEEPSKAKTAVDKVDVSKKAKTAVEVEVAKKAKISAEVGEPSKKKAKIASEAPKKTSIVSEVGEPSKKKAKISVDKVEVGKKAKIVSKEAPKTKMASKEAPKTKIASKEAPKTKMASKEAPKTKMALKEVEGKKNAKITEKIEVLKKMTASNQASKKMKVASDEAPKKTTAAEGQKKTGEKKSEEKTNQKEKKSEGKSIRKVEENKTKKVKKSLGKSV